MAKLKYLAGRALRSKVTSRLICLIGISLVIASLAADRLTGAPTQFGGKQLLGCLYGTGIFVVGVILSKGTIVYTFTTIRWAAALFLVASSFTLSAIWPTAPATWIMLGYVAAIAVLLPLYLGTLTLVSIAILHFGLTWISAIKTDLTGLPLTVLDIRIALANPAELWDALGLSHWTRYLTIALIAISMLFWLGAFLTYARLFVVRRRRAGIGNTVGKIIFIGVIGLLILSHVKTLYSAAAKDESTWLPERVSRLASRMGVLPFLAYSFHLESKSTGDIYKTDDTPLPPSAEEVRAAVLTHVNFEARSGSYSQLLPNILVVLAESTFDPGATFRLHGIPDDELFRPGQLTAASGPLRVNAVGGGTWISEFETIVGLDSRLFGYSGMYTHASLSPFVNHTFATYLTGYGYRTWAFFPNRGDFYNARNAYEHYGFERIFDSEDLGYGGWIEDDLKIAASVQSFMDLEPDEPFFGYTLFLENHSPHECNPADSSNFSVRFLDDPRFVPNCALHEYLRRLRSTTSAIQSLVDYLAGIEDRTGRPFVLLVFGDHQPSTFVSSGGTQFDYSALRKQSDVYTTFFHILSSRPGQILRCCSIAPPAAMLPTLLSSFVAQSSDDMYLGVNLWLYAQCGSDAVRRDFGDSMEGMKNQTRVEQSESCGNAYDRALAAYRASGIVQLGRAK